MNRNVTVRAAPSASLGIASSVTPAIRVDPGLHFERIYRDNVAFVWRVLRGLGVPDSGVEDAVQDVFVVVHRRLPEFDGRNPVKTWLFAIALRVASDHRRKLRRSEHHAPLEEGIADGAPTPADRAEHEEGLRILSSLLDRLDDEQRAVLVLADIEGMTMPEIAVVTNVPLNTAYSRLRRARHSLNTTLAAWKGQRR